MFAFTLVIYVHCVRILCVIAFRIMHYLYCITWDCFKSSYRALHVLFDIVHCAVLCWFFYERIVDDDDDDNDDDDDDDDDDDENLA